MKRLAALSVLAGTVMVAAAGAELTSADDIQKALDAAAPGDTIVLKAGVYYQSLLIARGGTPGKPVTLRAAMGGTATISGAVPPAKGALHFEFVEGDLYRAAAPRRVLWAMNGSRNIVNFGILDHLKSFAFPNYNERERRLNPCVPEGFAWQDGHLYVRLADGADPRRAAIEISRADAPVIGDADPDADKGFYAPDTGFWIPGSGRLRSDALANIVVRADHVVIEGLRLHMGVGASVVVHGNDVTVRDCYMSGAHMGVFQPDTVGIPAHEEPGHRTIKRANRTARGLTVEYCEFSCFPAYDWGRRSEGKWGGIYSCNIAGVFMNYGGPRSIVRHNWLYECFDGVQPRGNGTDSPDDASEFAYNIVQNCFDDSIEFDSATAMNLRVHHNFIVDGQCLLSLCPVMDGGLTIDHNILYASPERGRPFCGLFKLGSPWGNGLPTQGMRILHNTMVNTQPLPFGFAWCGGARYTNNLIENNIFYVAQSQGWSEPGLVFSPTNLYCGPRMDRRHIPEMIHYKGSPFVSMQPMDFALRTNSPAVDAGAAGKDYYHESRGPAPDLGAIELGDTWQFPSPGPRWARGSEIANRPTPLRVRLDLWKHGRGEGGR